MDFQKDKFAAQLIAELLDAQEQAFAVLAGAVGDVVGHAALSRALDARIATAQAAADHPTRDRLLATAALALRSRG